jgi:hypothetical protein
MLSKRALISVAVTAASLINVSQAWWGTGHMLVARIAFDKLTNESPAVVEKSLAILKGIAAFTDLEKDHPFVECATFADDIKGKGFDDQAHWHFVDNPFFDGYTTVVNPELYNITWAIGEMQKSLKNAKETTTSLPGVSY